MIEEDQKLGGTMFGHQNNSNDNSQFSDAVQHGSDTPADGTMGGLEPKTIAPTATAPSGSTIVDDASIGSYVVTDLPSTVVTVAKPVPASPPVIPHPADPSGISQISQSNTTSLTTPPPITPSIPVDNSSPVTTVSSAPEAGDLLSLKQSALHELSPLLGHLEQTPEEKFRTTMMMIQASDDHTMLHAAYSAAKSIKDEKARAQALLDVVNEINYFTQATAEASS